MKRLCLQLDRVQISDSLEYDTAVKVHLRKREVVSPLACIIIAVGMGSLAGKLSSQLRASHSRHHLQTQRPPPTFYSPPPPSSRTLSGALTELKEHLVGKLSGTSIITLAQPSSDLGPLSRVCVPTRGIHAAHRPAAFPTVFAWAGWSPIPIPLPCTEPSYIPLRKVPSETLPILPPSAQLSPSFDVPENHLRIFWNCEL